MTLRYEPPEDLQQPGLRVSRGRPADALPALLRDLVEAAEGRGLRDVRWWTAPFQTRDGPVEMLVLEATTADGQRVESNPIDLRPIAAQVEDWCRR
jgi:hypothetical protein